MAKNTSGALDAVKTILDEFLMSIKHIFRPKNHDSMTIICEVMSKLRFLVAISENGHCWSYATDLKCNIIPV